MYRRRSGQRTKRSVSSWRRSRLVKRIVKDQLVTKEDEINISNGIVIEDDRIRLQNQLRSRIRELIKLRKKHLKQLKNWSKKCQNLGGNCEAIDDDRETIFELLGDVNSVNNDIIKQKDNHIEELTKVYQSIPKKEQSQSFKSELEREHKIVEQTKRNSTESTKKLTKQHTQLNKELNTVKTELTNLYLDSSEKNQLRQQKKILSKDLTDKNQEIKTENEKRNQATRTYTMNANCSLANSQQHQTKSFELLENSLQNFINVLRTESPFSDQTTSKVKSSNNSIESKKQNRSHAIDANDDDDDNLTMMTMSAV